MKPNILFLSTHDTGRHFGCYGLAAAHTPAINRLAEEGVRCTNHFSASPICSPSRASMTTGLHPQRHGVMGISTAPWKWPLRTPENHISHTLRRAGYATALFGVHHETAHPQELGFESHATAGQRPLPAHALAAKVCEFLRAPKSAPFYAQVGFFETHTPYEFGGAVPDETQGVDIPPHLEPDAPAHAHMAALQGSLRQLDAGMEAILKTLDAEGLAENTLVVFTSDHGIEVPRAKWYLYDPGIATALLARWPKGGIPPGTVCKSLLSNVDITPTILDLAGVAGTSPSDGLSAAQCWRGNTAEIHDHIFAFQHGFESRAIRTHHWKFIRNFELRPELRTPASLTTPKADGGRQAPVAELYDLCKDPLEFHNVANDPKHYTVLSDLNEELANWMKGTGDPILHSPLPTPFYEGARAWRPGTSTQ